MIANQFIRRRSTSNTLPSAYIIKALMMDAAKQAEERGKKRRHQVWLESLKEKWATLRQPVSHCT